MLCGIHCIFLTCDHFIFLIIFIMLAFQLNIILFKISQPGLLMPETINEQSRKSEVKPSSVLFVIHVYIEFL